MNDFIWNLNSKMVNDFDCVTMTRNPVAIRLHSLSAQKLMHVFKQYSLFSKNITNFLLKAFYSISYHDWHDLQDELVQNIKEELNIVELTSSSRLPHYVLLRHGFAEAQIEIGNIKPSLATQNFMNSILKNMEDLNPNIVAGGVYALESSAVPELDMVYTWIEHAFISIQQIVPAHITKFFKSHVDEIEVGHEQRLQKACRKYIITKEQINDFNQGFIDILGIMDVWWHSLYLETQYAKVALIN